PLLSPAGSAVYCDIRGINIRFDWEGNARKENEPAFRMICRPGGLIGEITSLQGVQMRFRAAGSLAISAACLMVLFSGVPAPAGIAQPSVVSANPANFTPQLPIGSYATYALTQVGGTMYAGGQFSTLGGASRHN